MHQLWVLTWNNYVHFCNTLVSWNYFVADQDLLEVHIMQAKNLMAMDSNGQWSQQ